MHPSSTCLTIRWETSGTVLMTRSVQNGKPGDGKWGQPGHQVSPRSIQKPQFKTFNLGNRGPISEFTQNFWIYSESREFLVFNSTLLEEILNLLPRSVLIVEKILREENMTDSVITNYEQHFSGWHDMYLCNQGVTRAFVMNMVLSQFCIFWGLVWTLTFTWEKRIFCIAIHWDLWWEIW